MFQQHYLPYDAHLTTFYSNNTRSLAIQDENNCNDQPLLATAPTPANVPLNVLDINYYGGISQETSVDLTFLFTPTALRFLFNNDAKQYSAPTPHIVHTEEYVCSHLQDQVDDVPAPYVTQAMEQPQEQTSLPTPDSSPELQVWNAEPPVHLFTKPCTEDAIQKMIFCSSHNKEIGQDLFYTSLNLEDPGHTTMGVKPPLTRIVAVDEASCQYYLITPVDTELCHFGGEVCYQYPLEVI
ncbi:hypothetical protein F5141DRAFT_1063468 [Pisolithus sp. B1]|nr:hypothetical protein F5141DRAFT_1063468 [Pisolithus sp. B1]